MIKNKTIRSKGKQRIYIIKYILKLLNIINIKLNIKFHLYFNKVKYIIIYYII